MNRSRKVFIGFVVAFCATIIFLVFDISRKTTFPGAKSREKQVQDTNSSQKKDSLKSNSSPKSPIHQP